MKTEEKITVDEIARALLIYRLTKKALDIRSQNTPHISLGGEKYMSHTTTGMLLYLMFFDHWDTTQFKYSDFEVATIGHARWPDDMKYLQYLHELKVIDIISSENGITKFSLCFPVESIADTVVCWREHIQDTPSSCENKTHDQTDQID